MNDTDALTQERRIREYIDKWGNIFYIDLWDIKYEFYREYFIDDDKAAAMAHTTWCYREAVIRFSLPHFADMDDSHCENAVLHEFMHVIVAEMEPSNSKSYEKLHSERVVTTLAWLVMRLETDVLNNIDVLRFNG